MVKASDEIKDVVDKINKSQTWDVAELERLCDIAGMKKEWDAADGDAFESVAYAAAEKLGVEI